MNETPFPISIAELGQWAKVNRTTVAEARSRFILYVLLACIAESQTGSMLAFKGGNALRFFHGSSRSTLDLDFTAYPTIGDDSKLLGELLETAFRVASARHSVKIRVQTVKRRPPMRPGTTHPTYRITAAYQIPGDRYYADFEEHIEQIRQVARLEISINDIVCEVEDRAVVSGAVATLKVCSIEDIVAEKLRAILQQVPRNRSRSQDVYDIARIVRDTGISLDMVKVADFLIAKAVDRDITVAKSAFNDATREKAIATYERLRNDIGQAFIEFEAAWDTVLEFVAALDIPA